MKVIKIGGSVLGTPKEINSIADIIAGDGSEKVIVVSALSGVTDSIGEFLDLLETGKASPCEMASKLKAIHFGLLAETVMDSTGINRTKGRMDALLERWERVAFGAHYTGEVTPRTRDFLMSLGERLSAIIMEGALRDRGLRAAALEADRAGCVTDGRYGCALVDLKATSKGLTPAIKELLGKGQIPVVTGFFGASRDGHTTVFGRGGADYSAAIVANVMDAEVLEIWKDVGGFYTSDPKVVEDARRIESLSYSEAAELAYFGAKVLHPMTIWPLKEKGIPLWIGNAQNRSEGTWVREASQGASGAVKSVAHIGQIGILKFRGAGVGIQPGVLAGLVNDLGAAGINIKSVITSQTCIALLLDRSELARCRRILEREPRNSVESVDVLDSVGLIGIVGDDISRTKGIAGRIFSAVAREGINVEMISSGASESAYYFIIGAAEVERAVRAIHGDLFSAA